MKVLTIDREALKNLAQRMGISSVILHGSYATGEATEKSDIDVAVKFNHAMPEKTFSFYGEILADLEKALNAGKRKVDLVFLDEANILLRYEIMRKGKLLFGDEVAFEQYAAFAYRDYIDAHSLFELEDYLIRMRQLALHAV